MALKIQSLPGLYLHIPYCDTKCAYCDFYSITRQDSRAAFLTALLTEIRSYKQPPYTEQTYDTIYFGGGTPSLLTINELESILNVLYQTFSIASDCEITLEANPGTLYPEKLKALKHVGVNRLSMGVQSFDDADLKILGRLHTGKTALQSFYEARQAGFDNISLDLIFALPEQTLKRWRANLETIVRLQPEHISAYNLIFEPDTLFTRWRNEGKLQPAPQELEQRLYCETIETLEQAGYILYEVSNFARSEAHISRHNSKYWDHTPWLGFGPSAHEYWPEERRGNVRSVNAYIRALEQGKSAVHFREELDRSTRMLETIMLGLRTRKGIDLHKFALDYQTPFEKKFAETCKFLTESGHACFSENRFRLTSKGLMICDEIITRFSVD